MKNSAGFSKENPCCGHYDVVVFGGGSYGVCAATEAAEEKVSS